MQDFRGAKREGSGAQEARVRNLSKREWSQLPCLASDTCLQGHGKSPVHEVQRAMLVLGVSCPQTKPVDRRAVTWHEALTSDRLVVTAFNHGVQQRPHLLWVPQGLSKHLLNVSHDGYFLMSFERIFDSLRGGSPLIPEVHSDGNSPI